MKISYNPITAEALTTAPANNDITFDLKGLNIFVRGVKFKGTDTTYSVFKKHTSSSGGGYNGLVPVPSYTSTNTRFLREDGTWLNITMSLYYYTLLTDENLNDYKTEGRWYYMGGSNTVTNGPSGINGGGELYVGRNASGYRYLKIILASGYIWFRIWNNKTWSSWTRWYTDANTDSKVLLSSTTTANFRPVILGYNNDTSTSGLSASVTNQVYTTTTIYALPSTGSLWANKLYSGGKQVITEHQSLSNYVTINTNQTITGAKIFSTLLTANRIKITNTEVVKHIEFSRGNLNYITAPTSGSIAFVVEGQAPSSATSELIISNNKLYPGTTNVTYLGQSSLRWSNVYSVLGNFSGTVTSNGFNKNGSSNSYVLLGGGGHKALSDFALSTSLNNYVTINTALTITGVKTFSTLLKFTVAGGTAPFTVTSSTVVTNLNADLLDGQHSTYYAINTTAGNVDFDTIIRSGIYRLSYTTSNGASNGPGYDWGLMLVLHGGGDTIAQLAFLYTEGRMKVRAGNPSNVGGKGSWSSWKSIAFITDNVASATKLLTARTIWGQSFDGTKNISGNMSGVGRITFNSTDIYLTDPSGYNILTRQSKNLFVLSNAGGYLSLGYRGTSYIDFYGGVTEAYTAGTALGRWNTTGLGIGTTSPSYKLHVVGNAYASGLIKAESYVYSQTGWFQNNKAGTGLYNSAVDARWYANSNGWYADKSATFAGYVISTGFKKSSSSDSYVLLGGGGHKLLSELLTTYDGRYVGGNKLAGHGANATSYTADTYSSTFVNKSYVAFAERGSWAYAKNGYVTTDFGNIHLAGTAIFQWGASDTNKTLLFITPLNSSGVTSPLLGEMLYYSSNGDNYNKGWTRVVTNRNYTAIITKIGTDTVGSTTKPIYLNAGTPTASNATVGTASRPIYMSGGNLVAGTYTFGNASGNAAINNGTVNTNLNADMLDGYNETSFFRHRGSLSITSSIPTSSELTTNNGLNGSWQVPYPGASGHLVQFYCAGSARYLLLYTTYNGNLLWRQSTDTNLAKAWRTIIDTSNYTSTLDGRYFRYLGENINSNWNSITTTGNVRITNLSITNGPSGAYTYGQLLTFNAGGTLSLIYLPHNAALSMYIRTGWSGVSLYYGWTLVLTSSNYTNYTVTKTGEGASGTWGISITGSAPWANITGKPTLLTLAGITSLTNKNLNYATYNFGGTNKGDDPAQLNVPANYGMYLSIAASNINLGGLIFFNTVPGTTGTLYFRTRNAGNSNTVDTWKPWKTVLDSTNYTAYFNPANYVTALGTSGNYVTWTKNGATNNLTVPYATKANRLTLVSCYNGTTNNDLWSTIKTSNSTYTGTATIYEVYNDGGPTTYGEVLDIVSIHGNHWQPLLWFGSGKTGNIYYRNKDYNNDTWGNWLTILTNINYSSTLDSRYFRYLGSTATDGLATQWLTLGTKAYNGAYPDGVTRKIYSYGVVASFGTGSYSIFELYASHTSSSTANNGLLFRSGYNTDKKSWRMIIDEVNYPSYLDSRYVNVTGDTMTGLLTINRSGLDPAIKLNLSGTAKGCYGWLSTMGVYMYSYEVGKYISIKSDGNAYFGTTSANYKIWHAGNDGSGSGLNADLLDGVHASTFMRATNANGYYGLTTPAGSSSDWIRTTVNGIIPYQSGGSTAGHGSLGTSSWYFKAAYIQNVYGTFNGTATNADKVDGYHAGNSSGQVAVSNGTVCSNLNADLLDGNHASKFYENGYTMFGYTINASSLNQNTYYPVTFSIGSHSNVRIECRVSLNSLTKPSWSTHKGGFSTRKIWEVNGSGWGTNPVNRRILVSDYAFTSVDPVRGIGLLTNSSVEYVYVRGGGKYFFYISHGCTPVLRTSTYTTNSQSVAPTTTAPAAISRNVAYTSEYVSSLGTSGNYLTWVKNGATNRIIIPYATNADKLDGYHANTSQNPFGKIPIVASDGVMEVGRYLDFHYNSSDTSDYRTRLLINHSSGSYTATLPAKSGTLAMTSDIPTVTNYYWANIRVSSSLSTSTSPTFSTAYTSNWFRSTGQTGWYSETYGGGIYMVDTTYVRTYNSKAFYVSNTGDYAMYTAGGFASARTSGAILSTYYNNTWYKDTIYTHGNGNLSISPPGGNLYLAYNRGLAYFGGSTYYINRSGYFNGTAAVANKLGTTTVGSATKGIYLSSGTPKAMTYSLNATVNSGTANKLAYYSGTNTIDDYTGTVGSSDKPIYLNAGVPTVCSYSFKGAYNQPIVLLSGYIHRTSVSSSTWYFVGSKHFSVDMMDSSITISGGVARFKFIAKSGYSLSFTSACVNHRTSGDATSGTSGSYTNIRSDGLYWFGTYVTGSTLYVRNMRNANENNDSTASISDLWESASGGVLSFSVIITGYCS